MSNEQNEQVLADLGLEYKPASSVQIAANGEGDNNGSNNGGDNNNGGQGSPSLTEAIKPSEIFGEDYDSWDKVKADIPQKLKEHGEIKAQLKELSERPQAAFFDEDIEAFNTFVKNTNSKDFDIFNRIRNADEAMDALDKLVLKKVVENPELKGQEDFIKSKLEEQFGLNVEDAALKAFNLSDFKGTKAKEATEWLADQKNKLKTVKTDPAILENKISENKTKWAEHVKKSIGGISELEIPIFKDGKIELLSKFEIKPEIREQYQAAFVKAYEGYDFTDSNAQAMVEEFKDKFASRNLPQIISHVLLAEKTKWEQEYEDKNGGGFERPKPPGGAGGGAGKDVLDAALDAYTAKNN